MKPEQATKLRGRVALILFLAAAAAIWWALDRAEPRADWLRVEAPRRAIAGQPLPLRVHLAPRAEAGYVCADLHWAASRDTSRGYLASGGTKLFARGGGTFDFEIMVAPRPGLRFVTGVIYLSRTGDWQDHTLMAGTEVIPVITNKVDTADTRLEPLRLQPPGDLSSGHPHPAALPRLLTALLFLTAMVTAWGAGQSTSGVAGRAGQGTRWWQLLVVLLALAGLTELLGLESWLGAQLRAMARTGDLYYPRAVAQKAVISIATAATFLVLLLIRRAPKCRRLLIASFTLYLAVSLVNLMSLHAIDKVADLSWHGLSLVQALKLACAAMTWQGVRKARGLEHTGA